MNSKFTNLWKRLFKMHFQPKFKNFKNYEGLDSVFLKDIFNLDFKILESVSFKRHFSHSNKIN